MGIAASTPTRCSPSSSDANVLPNSRSMSFMDSPARAVNWELRYWYGLPRGRHWCVFGLQSPTDEVPHDSGTIGQVRPNPEIKLCNTRPRAPGVVGGHISFACVCLRRARELFAQVDRVDSEIVS